MEQHVQEKPRADEQDERGESVPAKRLKATLRSLHAALGVLFVHTEELTLIRTGAIAVDGV